MSVFVVKSFGADFRLALIFFENWHAVFLQNSPAGPGEPCMRLIPKKTFAQRSDSFRPEPGQLPGSFRAES